MPNTETLSTGHSPGFLSGLPVAARVVTLVGAPTVIALWLVWTTSSTLPNMAKDVLLNRVAAEEALKRNDEDRKMHREMLLVLYRICANSAKDPAARDACFPK